MFLGYEHNEIAEMARFFRRHSKSQLHKARLRLRKLLGAGFRRNARDGQQQDTAEVAASFDDVSSSRTEISLSLAASAVCFEGEL